MGLFGKDRDKRLSGVRVDASYRPRFVGGDEVLYTRFRPSSYFEGASGEEIVRLPVVLTGNLHLWIVTADEETLVARFPYFEIDSPLKTHPRLGYMSFTTSGVDYGLRFESIPARDAFVAELSRFV